MSDDGRTGPMDASTTLRGETSSVAANSASIAGWTVVSRVTGFARAVVIAAVFGPTFFGNLFQTLNTFPNLLYELVLGSLLASLLVPPIVAAIDDGDRARASRVADGVLGLTTLLFGAAMIVILTASPLLLRALSIGIDDPAIREEQRRVGLLLLLILLPQAALYGLAATGAAVQNARGKFALAAAAPVAENVVMIATFLAYAWRFRTGLELGEVKTEHALMLAAGSTTAVAVHAAVQWCGAKRVGHTLVPRAGWRDPDVRALFSLALPSVGYAAVSALRALVLLVVAGSVKGGVVALQFAYNFYYLPGALISKPLSVASLPSLSRLARARNEHAFHDLYRSIFRISQLTTLPAVVVLAVLATPISGVVARGAMASDDGRAVLAVALLSLSVGILGDAGCIIGTGASYARRDAVGPLRAMSVRATLVAAAAIASLSFGGNQRLLVLTLGASSADLFAAALLHRRTASYGEATGLDYRRTARVATSALAAAVVGVLVQQVAHLDTATSPTVAATVLVGEIALVIGVFVGVAALLGELRIDTFRALRTNVGEKGGLLVEHPPPAVTAAGDTLVSVKERRSSLGAAAGVGCALVLSIAVGVATPMLGLLMPAIAAVTAFVVVIYRNPPMGAYALLGLGPLVVGIDRGTVIPLLRLNEALLVAVLGVVIVRAIIRPSARASFTALDACMVLLAICGGALPLAVRFFRAGHIAREELLYTAPLTKLVLLYAVFRVLIKTAVELRIAMMVTLVSAAVVSAIGIAQVLNVFGVRSALASGLFYNSGDIQALSGGRGTSTIGSSIGASGFYVLALMIALSWSQRRAAPVRVLRPLTLVLLLGLAGTAQFSAVVALLIGLFILRYVKRRGPGYHATPVRGGRALLGAALIGATGWVAFAPRLESLAAGRLPQSWTARWDNLATHFLPPLQHATNLLWGVTPVPVVSDPRGFVAAIWIESGYIWLFWTGGALLFGAFFLMVVTHLRFALRSARHRDDEFGAIAASAVTALAILCGLMILDPHITLRGTGDLLFPLLALAATAATGSDIESDSAPTAIDKRLDVVAPA